MRERVHNMLWIHRIYFNVGHVRKKRVALVAALGGIGKYLRYGHCGVCGNSVGRCADIVCLIMCVQDDEKPRLVMPAMLGACLRPFASYSGTFVWLEQRSTPQIAHSFALRAFKS